ncbi:MAG: CRTAC1 family protein [Schlesneria sp.]
MRLERHRCRKSTTLSMVIGLVFFITGCHSDFKSPNQQSRTDSPDPLFKPAPVAAKPMTKPVVVSAMPDDWFEDLTPKSGIDFANQNGRDAGRFLMIESFGGGVAIVDYDLDGMVDVFVTGGGTISRESPVQIQGLPPALFRNHGDWNFLAVTSQAGLAMPIDYSQGCAVTDWNADGFPDVFVCSYGRSRIFLNSGDGTFLPAIDDRLLPDCGWGTAAAFGDWNGDSLPDLFLTRYTNWKLETDVPCYGKGTNRERDLCGPTTYPPTTSRFFRNSGHGTFEDWSDHLGLVATAHGLGVIASDLNLDGSLDFYVTSDALPNHLFLGGKDQKLVDNAMEAGVAVGEWGQAEASMGVDVADYNGDGLPDIFVTNFEKEDHALYRNLGHGMWKHSTISAGLSASSRLRSGFGTAFCDFDGDHWPDLFILNGNPIYTTAETPYAQRPQLFRNREGKHFEEISLQCGPYFHEEHSGRGNAVADLDNDGDFDIITVQMNEPVRILRNRRSSDHFIGVQLHARNGERDAVGARLICHTPERNWTQFVVRGGGYFSQSDPRIIFPCDEFPGPVSITVCWPGRRAEVFHDLTTSQFHHLVEGRGASEDE